MDKDVVYAYNEILFCYEKNDILPFATTWWAWRVLGLVNKSDKDILYVIT